MKTPTTHRLLLLLTLAAAGAACSSEVTSTVLARPVLDDAATAGDAATPDDAREMLGLKGRGNVKF